MIAAVPKAPPLNSSAITQLHNYRCPCSSVSPLLSSSSRLKFPRRRRRFRVQASSLVLPLLPFPIDQVFVPSEAKTLHLYEARYLALLEESLFRKNRLFVHFVLDQIGFSGTSAEASFAAKYGCLVTIERVQQVEIGALVSIRGVGRVQILQFKQVEPYLTGEVTPLQDSALHKMTEIKSEVCVLKEALLNLNSLEIKLKAPGDALLQTQTTNSLTWAEKQLSLHCIADFIPSVDERVSFAALQPVSGATPPEMVKLQGEKLTAMDMTDTLRRLEKSVEVARNNIAVVAAKLAIQSLETR